MGQVGFEDHFSVFLVKTELEGSDGGSERQTRIVEILPFDLATDEDPVKLNAIEGVGNFLVPFHGGSDVIFFLGLGDFESVSGGGDFGGQIGVGGVVDLVGAEAVHLVDNHGELGGESVEDVSKALIQI